MPTTYTFTPRAGVTIVDAKVPVRGVLVDVDADLAAHSNSIVTTDQDYVNALLELRDGTGPLLDVNGVPGGVAPSSNPKYPVVVAPADFATGKQIAKQADGTFGPADSSGSGVILPWAATTAYKQGQPVTQGGVTYLAKVDFTSGATFNAANWDALPVAGGGLLYGSGAPANTLGSDGQSYIDTAASPARLYGPKASGAWPGTYTLLGGTASATLGYAESGIDESTATAYTQTGDHLTAAATAVRSALQLSIPIPAAGLDVEVDLNVYASGSSVQSIVGLWDGNTELERRSVPGVTSSTIVHFTARLAGGDGSTNHDLHVRYGPRDTTAGTVHIYGTSALKQLSRLIARRV